MTHILRGFAFCVAALGLGLILDGYGVFAMAHPQALTQKAPARNLATTAVTGVPAGLRVQVVDTLTPAPALDDVLARGSALNPCLPAPRVDLALLRPSLARG